MVENINVDVQKNNTKETAKVSTSLIDVSVTTECSSNITTDERTENSDGNSQEPINIKFPWKNCWIVPIIALAITFVASIAFARFVVISNDTKKIIFFIVSGLLAIFAFVVALSAVVKILKPFTKIYFLKEIINAKISDKELIKKYCDTLVEL